LLAPRATEAQEGGDELARGEEVYVQWCAGCHGVDGTGDGPGAARMLPRPRDFTRALYQVRTTPSGGLPTDEDILHVIDVGMPGTAMPGWEDLLSRGERDALVAYVKSLSPFFANSDAPEPVDFGSPPRVTDEVIAEGDSLYQEIECWRCHGQAGRGDGTSAPTLEDDAGFPIWAADLTENWHFNGCGTVEDIFRRLWTGMDGTPMPTFTDMIDAGIITEEQLWSVAHYVRSLSPEERPEVREVLVAERLEGAAVPTAPDDERWDEVERFYVPLVGQIIVSPRWFDPRVDGIWVQALHDGSTLALRVSWSDPSASPDPEWADFATAVEEAMEPEEDAGWAPGAPDRLVVQFPQTLTEGRERPYFLQGDARRPAYLWTWESGGAGGREQVARGLGTAQDQEASEQQLQVSARHEDGRWQVVLVRDLATADSTADLQMAGGRTFPVAFRAWDGDNAEVGNRGAISSWYFLHLREPTPVTAYVAPVVALLLTALLGLVVIRRAKAREEEAPTSPSVGARPAGATAGG
ncbi:MAG: c-type cytochrome, partial [Gemmatimonadota bacterium]